MSEQNNRPQNKMPGGPGGARRGGFMGGPPMGRPVEKAKNFKGTLKRLIRYLKPHRINLIVVLIFAVLSTTFTIVAPKVQSQATNKLQDAYMARMMLGKLDEAQTKMVDGIYDSMAAQVYKGVVSGQKTAVNQVYTQMAMAQKALVAQFAKMMQASRQSTGTQSTGTPAAMDPAVIQAAQALIKLPAIDTIKDPAQKLQTTLTFMELLKKMPAAPGQSSGQMSPETLKSLEAMLKMPAIDTIQDPAQKVAAIRQFLKMSESMQKASGKTSSGASAMQMDPATLDKVLERIPYLKTTGGQTSGTKTISMSKESQDAVRDLLKLPMLSSLKDADERADTARKIVDSINRLKPLMKDISSGTTSNVKLTDDQVNSAIKAIRETNGVYDFKYIGYIVIILIIMYFISACFSLVMGLVMSGVSQKTVRDLRREVDGKLSRLPLKYFDMHPHGDLLSRVTNDIDTISTTLQQSLTQIITSVISIIGYIIMMLTINPILTLIVIATLPLYIIATGLIAKTSQKFFAKQQKELGDLSGHVEEMYTGHKIVKAFGHEKDSIKTFEDINSRLYSAGWKAQFVSGIMFPLMNFISNLGYVLICIVGGIWITKGTLKLGDILAFIQYSRSFTMPIVQTANIANIIQSTVACAERVFEVLDEAEENADAADAVVIDLPKGQVRFKHVSFRYKEEVPLIEDMNLKVFPGDTVAIVGPTGAGKTTLVNLLMRFYEINGGKISVDGFDIRDIKRAELRRMFGMVLQDTWLFNGTIKDNIAYGREGATMEEIIRAARAAHADHFIRTLPEGYNTVLNEEATNISQGQKQLLTIARAILADPTILILDEATSSVDTRTEVLIQKAMANLMKNRTSFVIAHRLSTIRDAETILVMNHGSIIEQGNHKQLLEKGGFYADLYNSQFTGANLENEAV